MTLEKNLSVLTAIFNANWKVLSRLKEEKVFDAQEGRKSFWFLCNLWVEIIFFVKDMKDIAEFD